MDRIIRNRQVVADDWTLVTLGEGDAPETLTLPVGAVIVPFAVWTARRDEILAAGAAVGVWLDPHEDPAPLAPDFGRLQLIAVNFPKFTDGRGYSTARLLRSRFGWHGELRAVGDVLHDQLFYLRRVGFDSFALKDGKDIEGAIAHAFDTWSETYQTAVDVKQPLFKRRAA